MKKLDADNSEVIVLRSRTGKRKYLCRVRAGDEFQLCSVKRDAMLIKCKKERAKLMCKLQNDPYINGNFTLSSEYLNENIIPAKAVVISELCQHAASGMDQRYMLRANYQGTMNTKIQD